MRVPIPSPALGALLVLASAGCTPGTETPSPSDRSAGAAPPGLVSSEFIFETAPFASCHASTIAETADGLVAAWFGGSRESNSDVSIWLSRRGEDGWSTVEQVAVGRLAGGEPTATWNPVLFQPRSGSLMLFYKAGPDETEWWGELKSTTEAQEALAGSLPAFIVMMILMVIVLFNSVGGSPRAPFPWGSTGSCPRPRNSATSCKPLPRARATQPAGRAGGTSRATRQAASGEARADPGCARLAAWPKPNPAADMPLPAILQCLRHRGPGKAWCNQGWMAGRQAYNALQSMGGTRA